MKKLSTKKTLGTIGTLVIYGVFILTAIRCETYIRDLFWPVIVFVSVLFGIKTLGGVAIQVNRKGKDDEKK